MRDAHRMKEKFDLSLDNRQIVSLGVGAVVVLGAVFVLGVVVGKKLTESGRADTATNILAALDEKKAAMEAMESEEPELTFHKALTNTENPDVRVVTLAPAEPKPAPVEVAKAPEPAPAPEKAEQKEPEPKPAAPSKPVVVVAAAAPDEGRVEQAAVPTRTAEKKSTLADAIARAQRAPPAVPVAPKGNYTLQLSAAPSRPEAERFAASLEAKGYAPYVVEAEVPGKGIWFRVRMGRFASKEAAQRYLTDFRRETRMEAFVAAVE